MGENALYRLKDAQVMARVGRSAEASRKEVDVACWLASHQFPAVRLADTQQVIAIQGMAVTFWEFIDSSDQPATSADLGRILRALHDLPDRPKAELPRFVPMPKIDRRLETIGSSLPTKDHEFLKARKAELEDEFSSLEFELETGAIHGDAHRHNLIRDSQSGKVRLIDLEDFCFGPREWDACVEAIGYDDFGWITDVDYRSYVEAYGFDPLQWSGYPVIKSIRELNMTTWLAQMLGQSREVDDEVHRRINDLRDDDAPRKWRTF
ncbi:aminoglycoside phosphotransferase family protein [Amycolatopsis aidingensis]|uniref:aminoglycoside phosphotransferase family protein n=1 Tax=Amycolatopsis aidingensis TaxID=2842453 RepID=UPI001E581896|nr:aminoglycoside phosphotransferase family protein [Amycolatopsis aidingensis]